MAVEVAVRLVVKYVCARLGPSFALSPGAQAAACEGARSSLQAGAIDSHRRHENETDEDAPRGQDKAEKIISAFVFLSAFSSSFSSRSA